MPEPSFILRKHQDDICCVKFLDIHDNESDILSSSDVTGEVKLWSLETRRPIHEFRPIAEKCSIPNVEYNFNNNVFITQTRSPLHGWIHGWDINKLSTNTMNNKPIFKFDTHTATFCRFSVVNHLNQEINLKQNDDKNKNHENDIDANDEEKEELSVNPNESLLSKMLKNHNQNIKHNQDDEIKTVSNNIDSKMLIVSSGHNRGVLQMWDAYNSKLVHKLDFDELSDAICSDTSKRGMIMSVNAFYTNKRNDILIVIVSESGIIDVYDVRASKILMSKKFGDNTPLTTMSLNHKRTRGICAGSNNVLYGFEIKYSAQTIKLKKEIKLKNDGVNVLKIRNYDQKIFGVGGWDHRTKIYNFKTFKQLCILKGHKGAITDIDFHPNKNLLATSSKDAKIAVYELY